MTVTIDRDIYSDTCVSKVAYWLTNQYSVLRTLNGNIETMTIKGAIADEDLLRKQISQQLNDYKLRQIIESETHDIRTILYAKAFADCEDLEV